MIDPAKWATIWLIVAEIRHRRDPERFRREMRETYEEAERELDEILSS